MATKKTRDNASTAKVVERNSQSGRFAQDGAIKASKLPEPTKTPPMPKVAQPKK